MSDTKATKDTTKGEDWRFQLSWKLGQHMLNVRAVSFEEFRDYLKALTEAPEMIASALSTFDFEPPAPVVPIQQALPAPAPKAAAGGQEIGPVKVTGYADKPGVSGPESKNPGKAYVRHQVTLEGGIEASTFDGLVANVAQTLLGKLCYARLEQRGKYYNLVGIRPAA
jgi:hypothetical protein